MLQLQIQAASTVKMKAECSSENQCPSIRPHGITVQNATHLRNLTVSNIWFRLPSDKKMIVSKRVHIQKISYHMIALALF